MAARGSTLGRKQEDAIAALLTQRNVEEAARNAGIGARTLLRWMKLPEFQKAYREARRASNKEPQLRLRL
jgi:transposase-like protein